MTRLGKILGSSRRFLLSSALFVVSALPFLSILAISVRCQTQSQTQNAPANATVFEYEVASIKPAKAPSSPGGFRFGLQFTEDGFTSEGFPVLLLMQTAYGVSKDRISGAPDWLDSDRYDIEAKMDSSTADELKKLGPADLKVARQRMLQALL